MAQITISINLKDLKKQLEFLRKSLDYRKVKFCKKKLDEILKKYFKKS